MNYPLISEYVKAIESAEDNFEELQYLRPVLDDEGEPVMTGGNFAVVFKMRDVQTGNLHAVKCFQKEQEGRAEAYHLITEALKEVDSPYLTSFRYLDKELFVDTEQTTETEFPVLLMDWVEGKTLDRYLRDNIKDKIALEKLSYSFYRLAKWLISQPFAHGDLKPDNILVKEDGTLVLVDYDGMYVPAMKGQKARELGSPDFRHPLRTENDFDEHIDDFSIISILLSLCITHITPSLFNQYGAEGRLLFSAVDYTDIDNSLLYISIPSVISDSTNYKILIKDACEDKSFSFSKKGYKLSVLHKPSKTVRAIPNKAKQSNKAKPSDIMVNNLLNQGEKLTDYLLNGKSFNDSSFYDDEKPIAKIEEGSSKQKNLEILKAVVYCVGCVIFIYILLLNDGDIDSLFMAAFFIAFFIAIIVGVIYLLYELVSYIKEEWT